MGETAIAWAFRKECNDVNSKSCFTNHFYSHWYPLSLTTELRSLHIYLSLAYLKIYHKYLLALTSFLKHCSHTVDKGFCPRTQQQFTSVRTRIRTTVSQTLGQKELHLRAKSFTDKSDFITIKTTQYRWKLWNFVCNGKLKNFKLWAFSLND